MPNTGSNRKQLLSILVLMASLLRGVIFAPSAQGSQLPVETHAERKSNATAVPSSAPTPSASAGLGEYDGMARLTTSNQIALAAAFASAVIGLLALFVSRRSYRTAASALQLAQRAYLAERRLSVTSTAGKDCLVLAPARADQTINSVTLFFPQKIGISIIVLAGGDFRLSFDRISLPMQRYWDSKTPVTPGYVNLRESVPIPIVAEVHRNTKGESLITVGYYDLYSQYQRNDDGSSSITIKNLALNNFGLSGDDPQAAADRMLDAVESFMASQTTT